MGLHVSGVSSGVVAIGVKSATAPAHAFGQGQWESTTPEEQYPKYVWWVRGVWPVGDGCEDSAGIGARLGIEQGLIRWGEAFIKGRPGSSGEARGGCVLPPRLGGVEG